MVINYTAVLQRELLREAQWAKCGAGRECVRILDLRVQVHPGELLVSKQRMH